MPIQLHAAALTDRGRQRTINEDTVYQRVISASDEDATGLFIAADGVGGQLAGEIASYWAVETIKDSLTDLFVPRDPRDTLRLRREELVNPDATKLLDRNNLAFRIEATVQRANRAVRDASASRERPGEAGKSGTTLSMALVQGKRAVIANVGDSRTYLLRGGQLRQITKDHSLIQRLIDAGQAQDKERYTHPQRNLIYRSLGAKEEVEVDIFPLTLKSGDYLLLCTDGLWEMVRDPATIVAILQGACPMDEACGKLVAAANEAGGEDNIGVVAVRVS